MNNWLLIELRYTLTTVCVHKHPSAVHTLGHPFLGCLDISDSLCATFWYCIGPDDCGSTWGMDVSRLLRRMFCRSYLDIQHTPPLKRWPYQAGESQLDKGLHEWVGSPYVPMYACERSRTCNQIHRKNKICQDNGVTYFIFVLSELM